MQLCARFEVACNKNGINILAHAGTVQGYTNDHEYYSIHGIGYTNLGYCMLFLRFPQQLFPEERFFDIGFSVEYLIARSVIRIHMFASLPIRFSSSLFYLSSMKRRMVFVFQ